MGLRARANFHELSYLQARALRFNSVMALRISSLRIGIQFAPLRQLLGSLSRVAVFLGIDAIQTASLFQIGALEDFAGLVMVGEVRRTHGN